MSINRKFRYLIRNADSVSSSYTSKYNIEKPLSYEDIESSKQLNNLKYDLEKAKNNKNIEEQIRLRKSINAIEHKKEDSQNIGYSTKIEEIQCEHEKKLSNLKFEQECAELRGNVEEYTRTSKLIDELNATTYYMLHKEWSNKLKPWQVELLEKRYRQDNKRTN